jgi:tRNA modification GTPase
MSTHTIAAIATALSNSGISIIRISGKDSLNIVNKIFKTKERIEPNKIVYGKIYDKDGVIDEALVSYFKAPKSFTGEDVCEINCHGGNQITHEILELVLEKGAILAEPGEFSKRAFLNGKMDLSQAESVINLINAKTRTSARVASFQLEGKLSYRIKELREKLIELLAHIEVSVDYPEYDYDEVENKNVILLLNEEINDINYLINTFEQGRIIKDGINVAILGKPNVGKSSLLNKLANYDRAIVTDVEGTTRDVVEESINIGNYVLNLADTAGIRNTDDIVEKIGVEKSIKKLDEVDFVIYMLSIEKNFDEYDKMILSKIKNKGLKYVVLINKMDKNEKSIFDTLMNELKENKIENIIPISINKNIGIENLKEYIIKIFNENDMDFTQELIITNKRHKDLLKKSIDFLKMALDEINNNKPIDIVSIYINKAAIALGEIIGMNVSEDVINKIFEKFCLGK